MINKLMNSHSFLLEMSQDKYFPAHLVDKGRQIFIRLCEAVEERQPKNLNELYVLTNSATDEFNELAAEFEASGSEIETVARDCIATEFQFVAESYGFADADLEELTANRDW